MIDLDEYFEKMTTKTLIKWIFFLSILLVGLGVFFNFLNTASSVATAPGRVIQETMKTDNIIQSYEWFYDVNASFNARQSQVKQYKDIMSTEADNSERIRLRTELAAMQQTCRELAEKYNANSEKMNKSVFKGWSLPDTLAMGDCE